MLIWDESKRRQNILKHGIDFAELEDVFERHIVTEEDHGKFTEIRYRTYFIHEGRIAVLIWTDRSEDIRFISCRFTRSGEARSAGEKLFQQGRN